MNFRDTNGTAYTVTFQILPPPPRWERRAGRETLAVHTSRIRQRWYADIARERRNAQAGRDIYAERDAADRARGIEFLDRPRTRTAADRKIPKRPLDVPA